MARPVACFSGLTVDCKAPDCLYLLLHTLRVLAGGVGSDSAGVAGVAGVAGAAVAALPMAANLVGRRAHRVALLHCSAGLENQQLEVQGCC